MTHESETSTISKKTNISIGIMITILTGVIALVVGAFDFKGQVSGMGVTINETRSDVREVKGDVKILQNQVHGIDKRVMSLEAQLKK